MNHQELIQLVLDSFAAEKAGDIQDNLRIVHDNLTVTEMTYVSPGVFLPSLHGVELRKLMEQAFVIKGREYVFKTIVADEKMQTVMIEFVESYPDPVTGTVYRTPQVAVCVVKDGKLYRTRHYMDPRLSQENLTIDTIETAFQ